MLGRFSKDESGMTMGLVVITIVLIGVMGAGLLVFVQRDLEAVVEVNRGQKALEIAEAGVQVAKMQQLSDIVRQHYDRDLTNDCTGNQFRATSEDWSPNTIVYNDPETCSGGTTTRPTGGVTRDFAGGRFNVTIECFTQTNDPTPSPCSGGGIESAPEVVEASKRAFFKVTSTGYYPADGSGAKRKAEAIVYSNRLNVPTAYYTPRNIVFNGGVEISGVSFFAGGDISKTGSNSFTVDRAAPALYKDWDTTNPVNFTPTSNLNTVPRRNATGTSIEGAGFAAEGRLINFDVGSRNAYDYDSQTPARFVRKSDPNASNAPNTISYPFDPGAKFDLDTLEQIARDQGNFHEGSINIDSNNTAGNREYPRGSTNSTVFYVRANGGLVNYNVPYQDPYPTRDGKARGLIVVENGNLEVGNSSRGFDGSMIVTGNGTTTGNFTNRGSDSIRGFAIADGTITIGGDVAPSAVVGDFSQRPGFYDMRQWSWRECYGATLGC